MIRYLGILLLFSYSLSFAQLQVSKSGRYLEHTNGQPFFWLGDTAWELFHRLNLDEARQYLINRKEKGFTVIQAVALAELDGLTVPNTNGDLPLIDQDPEQPNEAYFQHIDRVIEIADSLGLYIGLLPTWGDKFNLKWGVGPVVFNPKNAATYGNFIGERYKDDRVIWLLGGDRNPETSEQKAIVEAMANAIHQVVDGLQLMTYHPQGGSTSADFFSDSEWLDLVLFQSGHWAKDYPNFKHTQQVYESKKYIPVLDGEPCYEDHPINWKPELGWFAAADTRRRGYWSLLSGAAGHTYGHHSIWQMWIPEREPVSSARTPWQEALDYEGAFQAGILRQFFEEQQWHDLIPLSPLIIEPVTDSTSIERTCRMGVSRDGKKILVYTPYGDDLNLKLEEWTGKTLSVRWFNPRIGQYIKSKPIRVKGTTSFDPPMDPKEGNDWVLVLEVNES